jgi:hypothetical protein
MVPKLSQSYVLSRTLHFRWRNSRDNAVHQWYPTPTQIACFLPWPQSFLSTYPAQFSKPLSYLLKYLFNKYFFFPPISQPLFMLATRRIPQESSGNPDARAPKASLWETRPRIFHASLRDHVGEKACYLYSLSPLFSHHFYISKTRTSSEA